MRSRDIDFDLMRSLVILSAFVLHYNSKIYLSFLAVPSSFVQNYIFTVGGFFFFTAGYMARKVYLNRYLEKPKEISTKLIKKGLSILILYLVYVFFMHVFTGTALPGAVLAFLFDHPFYTTVLFSFAILFMFTPAILYAVSKYTGVIAFFTIMLVLVVLLYNPNWTAPYAIKKIFLDRKLFLYPILPSLLVYFGGYIFAGFEVSLDTKLSSGALAIVCSALLVIHSIIVFHSDWYRQIIRHKQYFTLFEGVFTCFSLIIVRFILTNDGFKKLISSDRFLCIGIYSLHFYVISNLILGLLSINGESQAIMRVLGLVGTGFLAYLFTFWRFSISLSSPLVKVPLPQR